jgi:hypothetical protein
LSFLKSIYFEGYESENLTRLIKSITFFRFFLTLLVAYLLCKFDILNLKYFFISAAFFSILVSLDIIFQYLFDFNILGFKAPDAYHRTGLLGEETIAGGFIENFSFFSILIVAFSLKNKKYLQFIITTFVICVLGLAILFSGNRVPLIFFLFGLVLVFFIKNELRVTILTSLIVFLIFFKFLYSNDEAIKTNYESFYQKNQNEDEIHLLYNSSHARLVVTAIDIWSRNWFFGNGIKSFRIDCIKLFANDPEYSIRDYENTYQQLEKNFRFLNSTLKKYVLFKYHKFISQKKRLCSNHPHNYYLQILTETGILGFFVILTIGFLFIFFVFKNFKFLKKDNLQSFFILACVISLFLEMFPLRTTGSIFSTSNITYIVLISSFILRYKNASEHLPILKK